MGFVMQAYAFLQTNGAAIMGALFALWGLLEVIVRLTPTKKDDTALERVGKVLKALLDAFGIPNRRSVEVEIKGEVKAKEDKAA